MCTFCFSEEAEEEWQNNAQRNAHGLSYFTTQFEPFNNVLSKSGLTLYAIICVSRLAKNCKKDSCRGCWRRAMLDEDLYLDGKMGQI
jgi:hypothetical protein